MVLTQDRLLQLAEPFGNLMNRMQLEGGDDLSEIVTGGLYAIGVALAHMRVPIESDDMVSTGLSPLWAGYRNFIQTKPRTVQ